MATFSTGITATFGSYSLTELVGLSWSFGGGFSSGRNVSYTPVAGQVVAESLVSISTAMWGTRATLTITGGGVGLTTTAVCTDIAVTAEVNGVTRYSYTFNILDN